MAGKNKKALTEQLCSSYGAIYLRPCLYVTMQYADAYIQKNVVGLKINYEKKLKAYTSFEVLL